LIARAVVEQLEHIENMQYVHQLVLAEIERGTKKRNAAHKDDIPF
jgi:hypothetical protein